MAYTHLAFLHPEQTIAALDIKKRIDDRFARMPGSNKPIAALTGDNLIVTFDDGYSFHIHFAADLHVSIEASEIADQFTTDWAGEALDKEALRKSTQRIEFYGDHDPEMNYFNDSLFLLEEIDAAGKVIIVQTH